MLINCFKQVFDVRHRMFKNVYNHRITQAIDFMIADALLYANPVFKFEDKIHDPEAYS